MPYHGWTLNGSLHPANASRRIVSITVNMPTNMMGLYLSIILSLIINLKSTPGRQISSLTAFGALNIPSKASRHKARVSCAICKFPFRLIDPQFLKDCGNWVKP